MPLPFATACFAALLTLGSWQPPTTQHIHEVLTLAGMFNVSNLSVTTDMSVVDFAYTAQQTNLTLVTPSLLAVDGLFHLNPTTTGELRLEIRLAPGAAVIDTPTVADSCLPASVTVGQCTLEPVINASLIPTNNTQPDDWVIKLFESIINSTVAKLKAELARSCVGASDFVGRLLINTTTDGAPTTPEPLPVPPPEACNLYDNGLARMAVNVVKSLPELFGLSIGLGFVNTNTFGASVRLDQLATNPIMLNTRDWVYIPPGTTVNLELSVGNATCPDPNSITLNDEVALYNIRLSNADRNVAEVLFNRDFADALSSVATFVLRDVLKVHDGPIAMTVPTQATQTAPMYTMAIAAAAAAGLAIVACFASVIANKGKIVLDKNGNEVGRVRRYVGDAVIVIGACAGILLFAWSNQTTAAIVRVGGELDLYGFSLANSVQDMWDAGLKPLAIFIAVFCGFYPYFKLLTIVVFAVVLQRPQSKVLQFIDVMGKFSLLDSFVMIIMAEGLTVHGVAQVEMMPSFWVFMGATCLSIVLGNYATHGWRMNASVNESHALQFDDDFDDGRRHPLLTKRISSAWYGTGTAACAPGPQTTTANGSFIPLNPRSPRRWRPVLAGIAFVANATLLAMPLLFATVTYKMSGPGALVTGDSKPYSAAELIRRAPLPLCLLAFATAFVAPCVFVAGFARTRIIAAWCATDVFVLACLGGLFQLKQFTDFVLGETFAGFITIEAQLGWPIITMGVSTVLTLVLVLYSLTLGHRI